MSGNMEQIYMEHAKSVYRYLFSLTHDSDWAEELTQETFYRAVYSIDKYDGSCKMLVWLCQIAKHIWYQELAKRERKPTQELADDVASPEVPVEDAVFFERDRVALYSAIHSLNEPMREVVYLRLSSEFSFAQIGEILGKSENWVRVTFYRAKQKMMEVL